MKKVFICLLASLILLACQTTEAQIMPNENHEIYEGYEKIDLKKHFDINKEETVFYQVLLKENDTLVFKRNINTANEYYEEVYSYNIKQDEMVKIIELKDYESLQPIYIKDEIIYFISSTYNNGTNTTKLLEYKNNIFKTILEDISYISRPVEMTVYEGNLSFIYETTDQKNTSNLHIYDLEKDVIKTIDYPEEIVLGVDVFQDKIVLYGNDETYLYQNNELTKGYDFLVNTTDSMSVYGYTSPQIMDTTVKIIREDQSLIIDESYVLAVLKDAVITNKLTDSDFYIQDSFVECMCLDSPNKLSITRFKDHQLYTEDVFSEEEYKVFEYLSFIKEENYILYFYDTDGFVYIKPLQK